MKLETITPTQAIAISILAVTATSIIRVAVEDVRIARQRRRVNREFFSIVNHI